MNHANGHALLDRTVTAPAEPAVVYRDRGTWLGLAGASLQTATVLILALLVAPTLLGVSASQEQLARALAAREADGAIHAGQAEAMRVRALTQQADITAAQERTRQIAADNLRLAEEINRRLRGD